MAERIVITGSEGVIGTVLKNGLADKFDITPFDLPTKDARDYQTLLEVLPGHLAVIHLAWDTQTDNMSSGRINPDNAQMFENVLLACLETGVKRAVMASSVHADGFYKVSTSALMSPYDLPNPDSPYGAHKVFMERLGQWYTKTGLEVICIRFGGVGPNDKPAEVSNPADVAQRAERAVYLSHRDCISLVEKCLEAKSIPGNFTIIYGISNNTGRIHDISNPVGWFPQDNCDQRN